VSFSATFHILGNCRSQKPPYGFAMFDAQRGELDVGHYEASGAIQKSALSL